MLLTSERLRPCSARLWRWSSGRSTSSVPSSWRRVISPGSSRSSVPCGPLTATRRPSIVMSTPEGTGMGERPTRLIAASPHVAEDLAAHATLARLAIGHEPLAGREHGHAQTAEHPRELVGLRVDTEAGLRHPTDARDRACALGRVLHLHFEDAAGAAGVVLHAEPGDVALALEDGGQRFLELRRGHPHRVVHRRVGVADAGQHVGNGVGHRHGVTPLPTGLRDTGQLARVRQLAYADATQPELAEHRVRATAATAPRV